MFVRSQLCSPINNIEACITKTRVGKPTQANCAFNGKFKYFLNFLFRKSN